MADERVSLDALSTGTSYPAWATETTLEAIGKMLQGTPRYHDFMAKFAKEMSSGVGIGEGYRRAAVSLDVLDKKAEATGDTVEGTGTEFKKTTKDASSLGLALSGTATRLGKFAESAVRTDSSMKGAFGDVTEVIKMFTNVMSGVISGAGALKGATSSSAKAIAAAGAKQTGIIGNLLRAVGSGAKEMAAFAAMSVGVLMGVVDDFGQSLRKTADLGISFGESFIGLRTSLGDAALGLNNLEKQLSLNSEAFALMGGSVQAGVHEWVKWRKELIGAGSEKPDLAYFQNLGFAVEDLNDFFLKDVRNRILAGRSRDVVVAESTEALRELAKQTKLVSEVTGESRKAMMQQIIAAESEPAWQAFLANLPNDEMLQMQKNVRAMGTLYGFSAKQLDAVKKSLRLGGDVSLLAEGVYGDAFQDWKFMPRAMNQLMDSIQLMASGEAISDRAQRTMALAYADEINLFWDSPRGKLISRIGGSIIPFVDGFTARAQAIRMTQNREGLMAGTQGELGGLSPDQERTAAWAREMGESGQLQDALRNLALLGAENTAMYLQNLMKAAMVEGLAPGIEGTVTKVIAEFAEHGKGGVGTAMGEGQKSALAEMAKLFPMIGKSLGTILGTTGAFTIEAASFTIKNASLIIQGLMGTMFGTSSQRRSDIEEEQKELRTNKEYVNARMKIFRSKAGGPGIEGTLERHQALALEDNATAERLTTAEKAAWEAYEAFNQALKQGKREAEEGGYYQPRGINPIQGEGVIEPFTNLFTGNWNVPSDVNIEKLTELAEAAKNDPEKLKLLKRVVDAILFGGDITQESTLLLETLVDRATKKESLYTHDVVLEKLLKNNISPLLVSQLEVLRAIQSPVSVEDDSDTNLARMLTNIYPTLLSQLDVLKTIQGPVSREGTLMQRDAFGQPPIIRDLVTTISEQIHESLARAMGDAGTNIFGESSKGLQFTKEGLEKLESIIQVLVQMKGESKTTNRHLEDRVNQKQWT